MENKFEYFLAKVGINRIWKTRAVKFLCISIDNELKFDEHLSKVCLKAKRKLIKSEFLLSDFLNPSSNTASLSACLIVEIQTEEQAISAKELLGNYTMIMN